MKKIYLILSLLSCSFISQAQLTLTKAANEPVVGDILNIKSFDTVVAIPKNTGTGQVWSFSNMGPQSYTTSNSYTTVASSPTPALFTNANIALYRGNSEWEFYKSNASTFDYAGMIFQSGDVVNFSNLGTLYSWPIAYGSTFTDTFTATQTSGTNSINWVGSISYTAAGSGTIVLPGGGTLNNCLLVKSTVSVLMTAGSFSQTMLLHDYEYWSSAYKFPVAHAEYQTITTGTNVVKQVNLEFNASALPVGINENSISKVSANVFPNPASNVINIAFSSEIENYTVTLTDVNGKTLLEKNNVSSLDVSKIETGIYFLSINGDGLKTRKTVVITH